MELKLIRTSKPTDDSISLWFEKSPLLDYKPGQHVLLCFEISGKRFTRTYSFHTVSNIDAELAITVRSVAGGIVSNFLNKVNEHEIKIQLERIEGMFTLQHSSDIKRHLIMFAGGSGITPIFSILRSLLYNEPGSTVSLIYSNKTYNRIIFNKELHALEAEFATKLKVFHVITQDENVPADFPVHYKGRLSKLVTRKTIKSILAEINYPVEYYTCGPHSFMKLVEEAIRSISPDPIRINKEHFFIPEKETALDYANLPDLEIMLQTRDAEKSLIVKGGKSILQAALENNINLPYSCTQGQCGTCRAFLISGEVKLRKNHILTDEELKKGQILLCQGFPVSDGIAIKTSL